MSSGDQVKLSGMSRVSVCSAEVLKQNRNRLICTTTETLISRPEVRKVTETTVMNEQTRKAAEPVDTETNQQMTKSTEPAYNATNYGRRSVNESLNPTNEAAEIVFNCMYKLWKEERLCNVVLQAKGGDVLAHILVLVAYSEDLMAKINSIPRGEIFTIHLSDISKSTTQAVVNFAYTNQLDLTEHNVIEMLYCASELGIRTIMSQCEEYINQSIKPSNAVLFFNYATQYGLNDVKQKATVYISKNFSTMSPKDLGNIPIEVLLYVMSSDDIAIHSELDVFLAIVTWVDYNRTDRLTLAPKLLKSVRYQHINAEQVVTKIQSVDWLFSTNDCYKWLYQVMRFHALKFSGSNMLDKYYTPQRPRYHCVQHDIQS